jgi:hypothetical protein
MAVIWRKVGDHLLGGGEREVVGLVVGHVAIDAQHRPHLVQRLGQACHRQAVTTMAFSWAFGYIFCIMP